MDYFYWLVKNDNKPRNAFALGLTIGNDVVVWGCRMPRIELQPPADSEIQVVSKLTEFRFNMKTGQASEHIIDLEGVNDDQVVDFPRVNENLLGRPTQFAYISCLRAGKTLVESLLKVIICSCSHLLLSLHKASSNIVQLFFQFQGGPQCQKTCGAYFAWRINQRR
jgi:hypothetical protein